MYAFNNYNDKSLFWISTIIFDYKGFEDIKCNQIECKICESFSLTMDENGTCSQFNLPVDAWK